MNTTGLIVAILAFGLAACNVQTEPAAKNQANGADLAENIADLKGRWIGTSESIVRGQAQHHARARGKEMTLDNVEFTFTITGQDRRRFWGTVSSGRGQEPIMGVIGLDGKTIVAQDDDGLIQGTLVDANTIDLIYSHTGQSTVVAATRINRQS